jgi:hypothetical protein
MASEAETVIEYISAKHRIWRRDWNYTIGEWFRQRRKIDLGLLLPVRALKAGKRPVGKNSYLRDHLGKDQSGFERIQRGYAPEGAKRRYEAHFISKLTDCDGENSETDSSLDFAFDCGYITEKEHIETTQLCEEIGKMLGRMIKDPGGFLTSAR